MSNAAEVLDVLLDAIADRVVAKLRQVPAEGVTPIAPARPKRRAVRAPAEPPREVTDLDRARAKKALEGMGIR